MENTLPDKNNNVVMLNLNPVTAKKILREVAAESSRVFFSQHALEQMNKRGITSPQVFQCLKRGVVVEGPARGAKGNWELALEVLTAGDIVRVVCALDYDENGNYIAVITSYRV